MSKTTISEVRLMQMRDEAASLLEDLEPLRLMNVESGEGRELWTELFWTLTAVEMKIQRFLDNAPRSFADFELLAAFEELESSSASATEPSDGKGESQGTNPAKAGSLESDESPGSEQDEKQDQPA